MCAKHSWGKSGVMCTRQAPEIKFNDFKKKYLNSCFSVNRTSQVRTSNWSGSRISNKSKQLRYRYEFIDNSSSEEQHSVQ